MAVSWHCKTQQHTATLYNKLQNTTQCQNYFLELVGCRRKLMAAAFVCLASCKVEERKREREKERERCARECAWVCVCVWERKRECVRGVCVRMYVDQFGSLHSQQNEHTLERQRKRERREKQTRRERYLWACVHTHLFICMYTYTYIYMYMYISVCHSFMQQGWCRKWSGSSWGGNMI